MTVVVSGVGAITSLGATAGDTFDRIVAGERGLCELSLFDPGELRSRVVAEVAGVTSEADSRTTALALSAVREAIADAGLDVRARRVGLVVGGTTAGMFETESLLATLLAPDRPEAERDAALARMLGHPLSAPTDWLARELGPFVRARSLSSACSSGANALIAGAVWLELGLVDAVVCAAADALCRVTVTGFNALGSLDPAGARPFDVRRRGLTLGEGAGALVLERAGEARRARSALLGWAARSEAHHITNPEATGRAPLRALRAALARAGLGASDVSYVNAHGTGTPLNDPMEARVLAELLGDAVRDVPVSSQKGMIGHTLAASGAIEAVITVLAVERGVIPPTGGLEEPDPECALRHVLRAEERALDVALSSSFGFGGMDTALVFGRAGRRAPARGGRRRVLVTGVAAVTPAGVLDAEALAALPDEALGAGARDAQVPDDALDGDRARRLDRASRLAVVACERALGPALGPEVGLVLGVAFGAVDGTAEYMRRLHEKGPRLVKPAEFPSLVPSSPAGHASIYLGLGGPALVVADLATSGECALAQAWELVAAGEADALCAGAVEERSAIVEAVLAQLFGREPSAVRREGSVALALAAGAAAPLAELVAVEVLRDGAPPRLPSPPPEAVVVLGQPAGAREEALLAAAGWASCPRISCVAAAGAHEALGGVAAAVAVGRVAGGAPAALFVGEARGVAYAGLVVRCPT